MNTEQQKSGMAVTSLVLGILSLICLGILAGLPAIITGHIAHGRARKMPAQYGGAGMAIAGFIMGYLSILVTAVIFVALGLLLPAFSKARNLAMHNTHPAMGESIQCVNNMKNLGLAFRVWATDHADKFPFNVDSAQGGTREFCERDAEGLDQNAFRHVQVMANELSTPRILVCPSDTLKQAAASFQTLDASNVSYQIRTGPDVNETNPAEVLAICPIHGHELRCDGSVTQGRGR